MSGEGKRKGTTKITGIVDKVATIPGLFASFTDMNCARAAAADTIAITFDGAGKQLNMISAFFDSSVKAGGSRFAFRNVDVGSIYHVVIQYYRR
jgi:hypothetical protein